MGSLNLVRGRLNLARFVFVILFLSSSRLLAAQPQVSPTISVTVNKSMVFRLAERAKRVSVTQPAVADVVVVAPNQLLINGKGVGTTSLIVFDERGEVTNYDLIVLPDIGALRTQLRVLFPDEKVEVSTSGPAIVLKGEVSNEDVYDKILEIAQTYLPPRPPAAVGQTTNTSVAISTQKTTLPTSGSGFAGGGQIAFDDQSSLDAVDRFANQGRINGIVDLLVIKDFREIEMDVIVAEVATSKLREIGFDWIQQAGNVTSGTFIGSQAGFPSTLFGGGTVTPGGTTTFGPAVSQLFRYVNGRYSLTSLARLLQNRDVTEILAQPRMVMKNGRSGGFLAGGEFPVVQTLQNSFSVDFKPFGVRLDFVPTITWSDRIDLRVFPEVSEIDPTVSVQGVPGLKVRRTVNRVELKDGESLIIGGLLDRRILKDLTKFPLLGDVPILGALFRSTRFRNQESELVFVITPRIVSSMKPGEKPPLPSIEKYDDPDIRQVPVPGPAVKKPAVPGATIP